MWQRIKTWWAAERAVAELTRLDDRLLADMGIDRTGLRQRICGAEVDLTPTASAGRGACLEEAVRC